MQIDINIIQVILFSEKKGMTNKLMDVEDTIGSKMIDPCRTWTSELLDLFSGELNPVAPKAQKKVPVPEGQDNKFYSTAIYVYNKYVLKESFF